MKHEGLKKEIDATLIWFAETDINIYGKITQGTLDAFKAQNVELPEQFKKWVKN